MRLGMGKAVSVFLAFVFLDMARGKRGGSL